MGGSVGEGNVTPSAEFNIWADPEAAQRVFSSGLDVTMVGLDVTHKALMTPAHVAKMADAGKAGRLVADLYGFYSQFHRRQYGWDASPVHDAVAVAHVIDRTLLTTIDCGVEVDTAESCPADGPTPTAGAAWVGPPTVTSPSMSTSSASSRC